MDRRRVVAVRDVIRKVSRAALDWFYPRHCHNCGEPLVEQESEIFCRDCLAELADSAIKEPMCRQCGLPLAGAAADPLCGLCHQEGPHFDVARALFPYASPVGPLVRSLKFHGEYYLGDLLLRRELDLGWMPQAVAQVDGIVPVPLHWRRRIERGYNQSLLLARVVARHLGVKLLRRSLKRTRYTSQQARLTRPKRRENVRGAFTVKNEERLKGLRLLLVDDVMTSGATASECAKVLKKAGVRGVNVFTLARTTP